RVGFEPEPPRPFGASDAKLPRIGGIFSDVIAKILERIDSLLIRWAQRGFQYWLSARNKAMCLSACEGGGQSMSRWLSEREREHLSAESARSNRSTSNRLKGALADSLGGEAPSH